MASPSSMNSTVLSIAASRKSLAMLCSVSPTNESRKSLAQAMVNFRSSCFAKYFTNSVLPVPGAPVSRMFNRGESVCAVKEWLCFKKLRQAPISRGKVRPHLMFSPSSP